MDVEKNIFATCFRLQKEAGLVQKGHDSLRDECPSLAQAAGCGVKKEPSIK